MKKFYFLLIGFCFFGSVDAQIINFPDTVFKSRLITTSSSKAFDINGNSIYIDSNRDGEIQLEEAKLIYELRMDCNSCYDDSKIVSLEGIQYFSNLKRLNCRGNLIETMDASKLVNLERLDISINKLSSFDFSGLKKLKIFNASFNQFRTLDFSYLTNLEQIDCSSCFLESINLSGLNNLWSLTLNYNKLTDIDISNLSKLESFNCGNNQISNIDIKGLNNLLDFRCDNNLITSLDTRGLKNLNVFYCENNLITSLDFTDSNQINTLMCFDNKLNSLIIKNGNEEKYMQYYGNPDLKYICVDEFELEPIQYVTTSYGYTNCQVNSYCSFFPGGKFYIIQGNTRLDTNSNGCDIADTSFPNMKSTITDGTISGNIVSNTSGNYSIPVQEGTHTITPILENPNYYNVSPTSINVTFPTQTSPFTQNFCITPNGNHQDVEVTILPTIPARPGFDATYKIIYKNKGNQIQSGAVSLSFDDEVLDYVSAIPIINNQVTDQLIWDYTNLQPFETREITVILNVNSPMETPAVNVNDRLSFTALINPVTGDEKPVDNSFAFRQLVVGSFDPNDKTCLEGDIITPDLIGEYVHYLIRFENTGNYAAENIVVKDMIDLSKFDISTLVPTKASHEFVTKISDGNKVEFIFENINLPFDDATNDGYLAFKIKTLPTLKVGDTFTNEANIYFDYNFPILTNKAATTIQTLGISDFEFSTYFNVFPNPTTEVLNISLKKTIAIQSLAIYDVLGQIVIAVPDAKSISKIDVSTLKTGTYFIKMNTDKGIANTKFMKN